MRKGWNGNVKIKMDGLVGRCAPIFARWLVSSAWFHMYLFWCVVYVCYFVFFCSLLLDRICHRDGRALRFDKESVFVVSLVFFLEEILMKMWILSAWGRCRRIFDGWWVATNFLPYRKGSVLRNCEDWIFCCCMEKKRVNCWCLFYRLLSVLLKSFGKGKMRSLVSSTTWDYLKWIKDGMDCWTWFRAEGGMA